jgi:predicted  nucleic acid-binding Zn-ribbon protein
MKDMTGEPPSAKDVADVLQAIGRWQLSPVLLTMAPNLDVDIRNIRRCLLALQKAPMLADLEKLRSDLSDARCKVEALKSELSETRNKLPAPNLDAPNIGEELDKLRAALADERRVTDLLSELREKREAHEKAAALATPE